MNLTKLVNLYSKNLKIIWKKRNLDYRFAFHNSGRTITNTIEPQKMKPMLCIIQKYFIFKK
jgi:hypothetical protein